MPEAHRLRKADCADYGVFVLVNSGSVTPAAQRLSWTLAQAQVGEVGFYGAPEQEHLASDLPVGEASAMSRAISSYLR